MRDVLIIGGGPAGLNAALVLGRCRRSVVVCDAGQQRNAAARWLAGYLTRDGTRPDEFLRLGREEIARYNVAFYAQRVTDVWPDADGAGHGFRARLADGRVIAARKVLFATGVQDVLPEVEGLVELYGRGVHHCPYCDGWAYRDGRIAALGEGSAAVGLALSLRTWSEDVVACTNGTALDAADYERAQRNGIEVRAQRIVRLVGRGDGEAMTLAAIVFDDGDEMPCEALFFNTGHVQRSPLPRRLGCECREGDEVVTNARQCTSIPGVYLAGDADGDVQFVIVAAAEGATAATAINRELQDEDRGDAEAPQPVGAASHAAK